MHNIIDREKTLETLRSTSIRITGIRIGKTILSQYAESCRSTMIEAVQAMPPEPDVEYVRHGYWIDRGKTEKGSPIIQCSYCGRERAGAGKSKYCRDCGAKMDTMDGSFII